MAWTEADAKLARISEGRWLRRGNAMQQDWEAAAWSMLQPLVWLNRDGIRQKIKWLKQWPDETWAIGEVIERALTVLDSLELPKHEAEVTE